jgi:hypothetical protein
MTSKKRMFTVICDYRGGTYISQVVAISPTDAGVKWARRHDVPPLKKLGARQREEIVNGLMVDDVPVPLTGLKNVWCFSPTILRHIATVNLVVTDVNSVFKPS